MRALAAEVSAAGAEQVTTFYDSGERRLVSGERDATGMLVALGRDAEDDIEDVVDAVRAADGRDGFEVAITGEHTLDSDFDTLAGEDLRNGELGFGLPVALIVLLIVFGSVVAGLVPLLSAVISITVALALLALVGQVFPLSVFATNMLTGMGLALGIDYSLFVLSRFREERGHGRERRAAIAAVGATASRAVLFSGIAFTLAMVGLLLVPSTIMRSLAAGAIAAAVVSVAAALTLLPALLSVLGDRVNALRLPVVGRAAEREESRFWSGLVGGVLRRPVISLVLATVVLLILAAPVLGLRSGEAGVSTLPDRLAAKQGYLALNAAFPGQTTEPVEIVIDGDADAPAVQTGIDRLRERLAGEPRFGRPAVETNPAGGLTVLTVPIAGDPLGEEAVDAVRALRSEHVPAAFPDPGVEVLVGGDTAETIDESDTMRRWLPIVLAFVLALSFVLLTIAFRSLVVAAKAIVVNLLSVGAAYGLLVLVFQDGVGNELFGFPQVDTIEVLGAAVPLRGPVRALDGLPRVPAQPHPRALPADRRQPRRHRPRRRLDRAHHHRRRSDHRRRLQRLRPRRAGHVPADGLRRGRRPAARRHDRPPRPRPRRHATARRAQLVSAGMAALAARRPRRGRRAWPAAHACVKEDCDDQRGSARSSCPSTTRNGPRTSGSIASDSSFAATSRLEPSAQDPGHAWHHHVDLAIEHLADLARERAVRERLLDERGVRADLPVPVDRLVRVAGHEEDAHRR